MNLPLTTGDARGAYFEQLYQDDADPWRVRQRWYEARKRALLLACLPQQRYRNAYEPGCGNGELTLELARRCERLLAADFSAEALLLARQKLAEARQEDNVTLERHRLPQDWPPCRPSRRANWYRAARARWSSRHIPTMKSWPAAACCSCWRNKAARCCWWPSPMAMPAIPVPACGQKSV